MLSDDEELERREYETPEYLCPQCGEFVSRLVLVTYFDGFSDMTEEMCVKCAKGDHGTT